MLWVEGTFQGPTAIQPPTSLGWISMDHLDLETSEEPYYYEMGSSGY